MRNTTDPDSREDTIRFAAITRDGTAIFGVGDTPEEAIIKAKLQDGYPSIAAYDDEARE